MSISNFPYFGWTPDSLDEEELEKVGLMESCGAVGCIKGSVLLLYSRIQCTECSGTGMPPKDDSK